ncbi:hypothetical protein ACLOJK_034739 [Asimina triloba]
MGMSCCCRICSSWNRHPHAMDSVWGCCHGRGIMCVMGWGKMEDALPDLNLLLDGRISCPVARGRTALERWVVGLDEGRSKDWVMVVGPMEKSDDGGAAAGDGECLLWASGGSLLGKMERGRCYSVVGIWMEGGWVVAARCLAVDGVPGRWQLLESGKMGDDCWRRWSTIVWYSGTVWQFGAHSLKYGGFVVYLEWCTCVV